MPDPVPPDVLTVRWCPVCGGQISAGMSDQHVAPPAPFELCPGIPVALTYVLATNTDQPATETPG